MTNVVYVGPHAAIDLPTLGLIGLKRGEVSEVPDEDARVLLSRPDFKSATPARKVS